MKVLIVANNKSGRFSPFVVEQVSAIRENGIEIEYFGVTRKGVIGYIKCLPALKQKIKQYNPDLIHAHYGLSGLLANLQRKVPVVTTYHGSDINVPSVRLFSRISIILSRFNIFVSAKTRNLVDATRNSDLIPCGIDLKLYDDLPKSATRKKYNFTDNDQLVLFAGAFDNQVKNSTLAKGVVSSLPNVKLIELKGYTRQQVIELMYASDVFLMTSFTEGSPQAIKEAMACNRPIVSTDVGDVKWIMGNTEGCYMTSYDPKECASRISQAIAFSKKQKHTDGRDRIISLGLDNKIVADKILGVYNDVIRNTYR